MHSISASLTNPAFASKRIKDVNITHQSRFAGIVNSDMIGFQLGAKSKFINLNLLYEGVSQIPDTRYMLLDWGLDGQFGTNDLGEGNGILDEGERLDKDQLRHFNQHQIGLHGAFISNLIGIPIGIGYKNVYVYMSICIHMHIYSALGFVVLRFCYGRAKPGPRFRNISASGQVTKANSSQASFAS